MLATRRWQSVPFADWWYAPSVCLWLAGLNLRLSVLALPPVLPLIHRQLGLTEAGVAALAALPLLLFGLGALPGALLIGRLGARQALIGGLLLIGVSSLMRSVGPSTPMLYAATVALGVAIAVSQPTMPVLVRQWLPHSIPRGTAIWSNGLLLGTILSASLTLPVLLPLLGDRWEWSFAIWAVPAFATAGLIALGTRQAPPPPGHGLNAWLPVWRDPTLWQLALLQAAASLVYFGANAFIPDYLEATDRAALVAPALAALSLGQLPGSFVVGLVAWPRLARRRTALVLGAGMLAGLGGVVFAPPIGLVAAAAILGCCAGATLVLSLSLPPLLAAQRDVGRLTGGMLAIGYSVVWLVMLAAGAAWDATHLAAVAFVPLGVSGVIVLRLAPRLLASSVGGPHPLELSSLAAPPRAPTLEPR